MMYEKKPFFLADVARKGIEDKIKHALRTEILTLIVSEITDKIQPIVQDIVDTVSIGEIKCLRDLSRMVDSYEVHVVHKDIERGELS